MLAPPKPAPGRLRRAPGCSGANCKNNRVTNPHLSFFRFPKDRERCLKWIENCRRSDLMSKNVDVVCRNHVLCADHFERSQFMNSKRDKLIWSSIPTLFEVSNPPPSIDQEKARGYPGFIHSLAANDGNVEDSYTFPKVPCKETESTAATKLAKQSVDVGSDKSVVTISCQNVKRLSSAILTDRELKELRMRQTINRQRLQLWRLRKQVKQLRVKAKNSDTVEDLIKGVSNYLTGIPLSFFTHQLRVAAKQSLSQHWSQQERLFALALNHTSPEAYQLCSQVFGLPSSRTLLRWLKSLRNNPDFSELDLSSSFQHKPPNQTLPADNGSYSSATLAVISSPDGDAIAVTAVVPSNLSPSDLTGEGDSLTNAEVMVPSCVVYQNVSPIEVSSTLPCETIGPPPCEDPSMGVVRDSPIFEQPLDVFAPLSPSEADFSVANHEQIQIQFDSDQLDSHTLQLIADLGSVTPLGESATITAMREVSPEGTVTLTPITSGCPFTVSDNTVKLEIVTLGLTSNSAGGIDLI